MFITWETKVFKADGTEYVETEVKGELGLLSTAGVRIEFLGRWGERESGRNKQRSQFSQVRVTPCKKPIDLNIMCSRKSLPD